MGREYDFSAHILSLSTGPTLDSTESVNLKCEEFLIRPKEEGHLALRTDEKRETALLSPVFMMRLIPVGYGQKRK